MVFDRSISSNSSVFSRCHRKIFLSVSETPTLAYLLGLDRMDMETYSTMPLLVLYMVLWVVLSIPIMIGSRAFLSLVSFNVPLTRNFLRMQLSSSDFTTLWITVVFVYPNFQSFSHEQLSPTMRALRHLSHPPLLILRLPYVIPPPSRYTL